jgi:hypothetical protein
MIKLELERHDVMVILAALGDTCEDERIALAAKIRKTYYAQKAEQDRSNQSPSEEGGKDRSKE